MKRLMFNKHCGFPPFRIGVCGLSYQEVINYYQYISVISYGFEDQAAPADPDTRISSLEEVIKRISESMEAMKKTNEDLASRLPLQK
jgi:hypothetical protein